MKIKFKKNNAILYMQDFSVREGIPRGIMFNVDLSGWDDYIKLIAKNYGKKNHYGNGAIFIKTVHLPKIIFNKCLDTINKNNL